MSAIAAVLIAVSPLAGLWGSERLFPSVRGELIIAGPRATLAGYDVPVQREGGSIRFQLPGGRGEFRGDATRGHFVQPEMVSFGSRFATPVALRRDPDGSLRGTVAPLEDRFDLYVSISADGKSAIVRNPDFKPGPRPPAHRPHEQRIGPLSRPERRRVHDREVRCEVGPADPRP